MPAVLGVIADATGTATDVLRAECEVREAAHLTSDLRIALARPGFPTGMGAVRLRALEQLLDGPYWWRPAR